MPDYSLLIRLLIAHAISDFALQPSKWASEKDQYGFFSKYFYYHILVTGVFSYFACASVAGWSCIRLPLSITVFHLIIDSIKYLIFASNRQRRGKDIAMVGFLLDQLAHLLIILLLWLQYTHQSVLFSDAFFNIIDNEKVWIVLLGLSVITFPASIFIHLLLSRWGLIEKDEKKSKKFNKNQSGKWVGIVERLMIFVFVILGRFEIIGFLIAAKSIFRYHDIKTDDDQRRIEYVLTGTMISFGIAIICSIPVKMALNW